MSYQLLVFVLGISSVLFPALIVRRNHLREQQEAEEKRHLEALMLEERALFFEKGRAAAFAEVEKIRDDRGVSYRDAAKIAGQKCAECNRKCIHCAREAKSSESNGYDDYDADMANCEPIKTRWPEEDTSDDEDDLHSKSKPRTLTGER